MKRTYAEYLKEAAYFGFFAIVACFAIATLNSSAFSQSDSVVVIEKAQASSDPTPTIDGKPEDPAAAADRLTRRQKRDLGILPVQVLSRARQLVKDGDIVKGMTTQEMAFIYAADVASSQEYGSSWRQVSDGTYGVDWDGIIAFLERLFELLVKFLPIFM